MYFPLDERLYTRDEFYLDDMGKHSKDKESDMKFPVRLNGPV